MRERTLRVVLVLVGLLFLAGVFPLIALFAQEPAIAMMMSLYVTLGVFLLRAVRNPSANSNLIAFTAWSSCAHAAVMALQAYRKVLEPRELIGVVALVIIAIALIALAPEKQSVEPVSTAAHAQS